MIADIDKLCYALSRLFLSCNYLIWIAFCIHTKNIMEEDMMETVKIERKR